MSIINQTLRELDARNTASIPPQVPLRPVATALRHRPALWASALVLLSVAGMVAWFTSGPVDRISRPQASPVHDAPALQVARSASGARPATPPVTAVAQPPANVRDEMVGTTSPARLPARPDRGAQAPIEPVDATRGGEDFSRATESRAASMAAPAIRKEANKASPEDEAEERYRKAVTLLQKGRENQARPLLEEAIRLAPGHVGARQLLATVLSEAGQNAEAELILREGREVAPDNGWFTVSLARLQAARGDAVAAVATLQSGLEGNGVNAEYHAMLAALLVRLKQHREAARHYEQALKLQPDQGTWWLGLGLSLDAQGRTDEARSAYTRALTSGTLPETLVEVVRAKLADKAQ